MKSLRWKGIYRVSEPAENPLNFRVPSLPGAERQIMDRVAEAVDGYLTGEHLERLKTAVAEAALNAIEHGNQYQPELFVSIQVRVNERQIWVDISDQGGGQPIPETTHPDIEAKLAGLEKPRGWGLFIIRNMVDDLKIMNGPSHHTLELIFNRETHTNEQKRS
jgi:anti-sigma regulatory factor (Ser/Thr protein kinase)